MILRLENPHIEAFFGSVFGDQVGGPDIDGGSGAERRTGELVA